MIKLNGRDMGHHRTPLGGDHGLRIKVNKCPHVHYSNRTSAVSLQNEKETDKERPGTLAATAKWPGIDIPLYTAPTAPQ